MTRPLTKTELDDFGQVTAALADRVRKTSPEILQLLRDALDHGYSHRASTVPTHRHNEVDEDKKPVQPSTQPEAAVINPDQAASGARDLIDTFRDLHRKITTLDRLLAAWDPGRTFRHCSTCGHPLEPDQIRCQRTIDGKQCGGREKAERHCSEPADQCRYKGGPLPKGVPLRNGRCPTCAERTRLRTKRTDAISTMAAIHNRGDITRGDDQ